MAIDMAAIRKKLNQLSGQNNKKNALWRPEEGTETTVRLLAYPDNDGQPFKEMMFYYNIGNNPGETIVGSTSLVMIGSGIGLGVSGFSLSF